ncbi:MAG: hypothetical protein AUJ86_00115 [Hydrogenophilaceae bacterium CG1_02_62_390]|nr:hypothetical protein [Betaproteobacteria bacterium]OIO80006.1 MAG: hypothetical protein AUJ86_00115 [Hydrogenophilaceae bacterium CG1_02_62_390]
MAEDSAHEDSADIRGKVFVRLGIAATVTALALAALWWLDRGGKPPAKPATPAAIVVAPPRTPPEITKPAEAPQPVPAPEIQASEPPLPAVPPPPAVHLAPHQAAPQANRATAPAPQAIKPAVSTPVPTAADGRYAIQVGVFADPTHAQALVDRLTAQGIHAHLETRVQVGPYANRAEADKAQAVLKKLGITGLITPAARK